MPSSISDSSRTATHYSKVLLGLCALSILGIEISSSYLLKHSSLTYTRVSNQYAEAVKMRRARPGESPSVLIVGNSLLLQGIQLERLHSLTSDAMRIYPIFLEQTGYYDWLYGLRKMFREGARPDVVVLGVGVNYFLMNGIRPDYVPMMFLDGRDTLGLASDLGLDRTAISNLWLAHVSTFWDTRGAIRSQVLNHFVPHLEDLFTLVTPRPSVPERREFEEVSIPHLQRLRQLCEEHEAKLILLVPPTLSSESEVAEMANAANAAGVDVSVPINPLTLSAKFYWPDGMHLNQAGALLFTSALAKDLPERVVTQTTLALRSLSSKQDALFEAPR
jgi:hypothetical protein